MNEQFSDACPHVRRLEMRSASAPLLGLCLSIFGVLRAAGIAAEVDARLIQASTIGYPAAALGVGAASGFVWQ